jgi:mono/diheme cytochrome c family protein
MQKNPIKKKVFLEFIISNVAYAKFGLVCLVFMAVMYLASACVVKTDDRLAIPESEGIAKKGQQLVQGVAACGFCHGSALNPELPLSGGMRLFDRYGEVRAPNITSSNSGIAGRTTEDIVKAFRQNLRVKKGKNLGYLSRELHEGYEWISDDDLLSIISYLRTSESVEKNIETRSLSFWSRNTTGFFESSVSVRGIVPSLETSDTEDSLKAYGLYLANHVARCGSCHDSVTGIFGSRVQFGGGRVIERVRTKKVAPPLRGWSREKYNSFFSTGVSPTGKSVDANFCPTEYYKRSPQKHTKALATYLSSLPGGS